MKWPDGVSYLCAPIAEDEPELEPTARKKFRIEAGIGANGLFVLEFPLRVAWIALAEADVANLEKAFEVWRARRRETEPLSEQTEPVSRLITGLKATETDEGELKEPAR